MLLRECGEDLTGEFVGTSKPIPDDIYFGHSKIFYECMEQIYSHKRMCNWMSNPIERAHFCVKVMRLWVTCVKHTGIIDINYLRTKDGAILLRQLMQDLLCDTPYDTIKKLIDCWAEDDVQ